jgi:hypothetical protein
MQEIGLEALIRFQQAIEANRTDLETAWKTMTKN